LDPALKQADQILGNHRFRQVAIHAGFEAALAVTLHGMRGQRDDLLMGSAPFSFSRMAVVASKPSISGI
jgi:hypothetical protein